MYFLSKYHHPLFLIKILKHLFVNQKTNYNCIFWKQSYSNELYSTCGAFNVLKRCATVAFLWCSQRCSFEIRMLSLLLVFFWSSELEIQPFELFIGNTLHETRHGESLHVSEEGRKRGKAKVFFSLPISKNTVVLYLSSETSSFWFYRVAWVGWAKSQWTSDAGRKSWNQVC